MPPAATKKSSAWRVALVASGAALCLGGCVNSFYDFDRERRAYDECLEEHSDDPARCEDLRKRADEKYGDYERESQTRWGCEQNPDRCNEPRPGQR